MISRKSKRQSIFWERNRDKILIFGITTGILLFLGIEYKNELVQLFSRLLDNSNKEELKSEITPVKIIQIPDNKYIEYTKHVDVPMYVRKLPLGYTISPEKLKIATDLGYEIGENQTWVTPYDYDKKIKIGG